ncbi:MAG: phenylalanine--tRNA ligase subunit beta [Elusimicrobia bacterium]|nr:phenylalanine--tRNA ligase subunit beta [Elusimicrobiota bacterium]
MKILYSWLKDFIDLKASAQELREVFPRLGMEVAGVEKTGAHFTGVSAARITAIGRHPNADRLSLVDLETGAGMKKVVCGAKNIAVGQLVPLAVAGAELPGGVLKKAKIRGVESDGMICSSEELGVSGGPEDGIYVLPPDTPVGADAVQLFGGPDYVFELEIGPNRPDLLSHLGVARELSVFYGLDLRLPQAETMPSRRVETEIEISAPDKCLRYAGMELRNVSAAQSPEWMRRRLLAMGVNPKNILVDATNYVLHELGQPLHAFDLGRIKGGRIIVRNARDDEKFDTLDGQDLILDSNCLVIADAERASALAGVIGGIGSGIADDTRNVFIESAAFEPGAIHRTARKYALNTEAAYRFERGSDPDCAVYAAMRAAMLMAQACPDAEVSEVKDVYPGRSDAPDIVFSPEWINSFLGMEIPRGNLERILRALSRELDASGSQWRFSPPAHRRDLRTKWDLADEAARFHGYDAIPDSPRPALVMHEEPLPIAALEQSLSDALCGLGFMEARNYDFVSRKMLENAGFPVAEAMQLANPLSEDMAYLRPSLVPSLLSTADYNRRRGGCAWFFEIGRIYPGHERCETRSCAALMQGPLPLTPFWDAAGKSELGFHHLKGALSALLRDASGLELAPCAALPSWLHPKLCMEVRRGRETLGYLGRVHPSVVSKWGLKDEPLWAFEFLFETAAESFSSARKFRPASQFPSAWRDISVVVPRRHAYAEVEAELRKSVSSLETLELVDLYEGKGVPEDGRSLSFRLTFCLPDRTLSDSEVDAQIKKALDALSERFGAVLRG